MLVHGLVILAPIAITFLLAGSVKFDRGTSWVLLRAVAESIKGEIYRYRCRVDRYADDSHGADDL